MKTYPTPKLKAALFITDQKYLTTDKKAKQNVLLSIQWSKAIKRNKTLTHAKTWMNFKNIAVSGRSQDMYCVLSFE
jgi:hypothetical protein